MSPAYQEQQRPEAAVRANLAGLRLVLLHLASRRVPVALAAIAACAVALRIALHWPWNSYGARQLPLIFEACCAAAITVTTASPFGELERATSRRLPLLRLGTALALTAAAAGGLTAASADMNLAGGNSEALAWTGPVTYLILGIYALYTQWHGPAQTTPWIWPGRPGHDLGAAVCAGLVFAAGTVVITVRGARDPAGESAEAHARLGIN
jgi:hypothetical protein